MAETASPITMTPGQTLNVELSGVAGTLKRINPSANVRYFKITARTVDAKLVRGGTDAAAIGTTAYETMHLDTLEKIDVPGTTGGRSRNIDSAVAASNSRGICLAGGASAIIEVTAV